MQLDIVLPAKIFYSTFTAHFHFGVCVALVKYSPVHLQLEVIINEQVVILMNIQTVLILVPPLNEQVKGLRELIETPIHYLLVVPERYILLLQKGIQYHAARIFHADKYGIAIISNNIFFYPGLYMNCDLKITVRHGVVLGGTSCWW